MRVTSFSDELVLFCCSCIKRKRSLFELVKFVVMENQIIGQHRLATIPEDEELNLEAANMKKHATKRQNGEQVSSDTCKERIFRSLGLDSELFSMVKVEISHNGDLSFSFQSLMEVVNSSLSKEKIKRSQTVAPWKQSFLCA
eukprot:TRINITY_DN723_c0_g1_i2.p1 TRINITY_DN723_c0_g1~~TRINITY_DN723_c0_g1_i2.p1  ORF type:complete len:142 (-),score=29.96 TRINITY_DN723_c0_g1_i2:87-512(-)